MFRNPVPVEALTLVSAGSAEQQAILKITLHFAVHKKAVCDIDAYVVQIEECMTCLLCNIRGIVSRVSNLNRV